MNYPESLKKGDTIGICAPAAGIVKEEKIIRLDYAIAALKNMGYNVIETPSVRKEENGRSASAEVRANEFMSLLENDDVKLILFATGGDFLCEMIEKLDFEKIRGLKPKWMQGYSDITGISYLFNTILEIPSMYCQTIKDYAMQPLFRNLVDALRIESGEEVVQDSFELYESGWSAETDEEEKEFNPREGYNLVNKVEWKNLNDEPEIIMEGRAVGGCLDCIRTYIGTKYDNVSNYIEKYKDDGIIWFLECFEMSTPQLELNLWQMKNAGYFNHCKGIIFGRSLFLREDYDITMGDALKEALGSLNIPIIYDADIGHKAPQLAIVNGAMLKITSANGKGKVETKLR